MPKRRPNPPNLNTAFAEHRAHYDDPRMLYLCGASEILTRLARLRPINEETWDAFLHDLSAEFQRCWDAAMRGDV